jgi:predicted metalloprotease with PDZ domain
MQRRLHFTLAGLLLTFVCAASSAQGASTPLRYTLGFERPNTHLMDVSIEADGLDGQHVDFAMPDWAPGSYNIENYAAEVQGFHAEGAGGKQLAWRKTDGQTWRVDLRGATSATIRYEIHGNTLANNRAQYDGEHAFFDGPAVWMYMVDAKDRPIHLHVNTPQGWRIATGMPRTSENEFAAENYDWFADAPMEISDFAEKNFTVLGSTYHVIVHDVEGHKDFAKFTDDLQKTVSTIVPMFASVTGTPQAAPYKEYWFIFHIWPKTGGGLEHLNSTQIDFSSDWDDMKADRTYATSYDLKLFVSAHEFFHAWNVKRLRPKPLGPFDYSREVHTPSLWISEGLTSYYGDLMLVRSGLMTSEVYLKHISQLITNFEAQPGRKERSIEDTSWDTWFRSLKTENNLDNTFYSYYDGGQIVGHLLDFGIRHDTGNMKSLDDWMRLLYARYALPKPGFEPEDAIHAASEIDGHDMSDFFLRYINGKEPLPYETYFGYAGIEVQKSYSSSNAWLGVSLQNITDLQDYNRERITNVIPNSPAEAAGLSKDDVILAFDGQAINDDNEPTVFATKHPGDTLRITALRGGRIVEFAAVLRTSPNPTYTLKPLEKMSGEQKKIYESWLGKK